MALTFPAAYDNCNVIFFALLWLILLLLLLLLLPRRRKFDPNGRRPRPARPIAEVGFMGREEAGFHAF